MAKKKVDSIRHKEKRTNIPTEELRDFVADDERTPKTMLYPRDPSLDPQLVWKGKDDQDRQDLAVPVVPVYIQEKIHPNAIVSDLLKQTEERGERTLDMFADFNGLNGDFEKKIDFYSHQDDRQPHWSNRMILGDSLLVMSSLAEKEGLKGKVQTIYFDPPYGIKFGSNWQVSTRKRDVTDGRAEDATRQPEQIRAFRDTWKLGIHSYLAYLRDRLTVARDLLSETGSIFVQINDENVHHVRELLDEIFGSGNWCCLIPFKKTGGQSSSALPAVVDYLIWYAKSKQSLKYRQLFSEKTPGQEGATNYTWIELEDGSRRPLTSEEQRNWSLPPKSRVFQAYPMFSEGPSATDRPFVWKGETYKPSANSHWKTTATGLQQLAELNRLIALGKTLRFVNYLEDFPVTPITNVWMDTQTSGFTQDRLYVVQTLAKVIERCILMTSDPGDIVLDPTCGSGTTAYVAEQWGRRWITTDTSRVAVTLARTRMMAARYPYYLLADPPEGIKKEAELTAKMPPPHPTDGDIRKGFVYKRAPHVTLGSIANNPDIVEGMTREQIERAIARHSESETLFDQPYEDNNRLRVTGPFTVESLSPHRVLSTDEEQPASEAEATRESSADFASMIIENLKKAGVQNTVKNERLTFETLEPFAGTWIHAAGTYIEADGTSKRVAVSLGPEHGTIGPEQVKEAAKEAVQGIGYDLLILCGFSFDPHVSEEAKRYGKLTILVTRMNPDLAMGDELLKKTGTGNLFMVFGEPDLEVTKAKDGTLTVEVRGVDVYDPTTGQIRNSSTDDIACWFLDTSYDGESFFVRHAYFTGADEPYEKLKRALKAEVDEAAWASLYSTKSRPFPKPASGKIAVKVINHYGDEVLKVLPV